MLLVVSWCLWLFESRWSILHFRRKSECTVGWKSFKMEGGVEKSECMVGWNSFEMEGGVEKKSFQVVT